MRRRWWLVSLGLGAVACAAILFGLAAPAVLGADTVDEPVLDLDFGEATLIAHGVIDESGERNHGRVVTEGDREPAVTADSITFEGGTQHVLVELHRPLEGEFTVVTDVRAGNHDYYAGIVTSEDWWLVAHDDRFGFYTPETGIATDHGAVDDATHQVTGVYREGTLELYLDGEYVDGRHVGEGLTAETLYVGQRPEGLPLEGAVESVQVYDRAATTSEVRELHAGTTWLPSFAYEEWFRSAAVLALVLVALVAAALEVRFTNWGETAR